MQGRPFVTMTTALAPARTVPRRHVSQVLEIKRLIPILLDLVSYKDSVLVSKSLTLLFRSGLAVDSVTGCWEVDQRELALGGLRLR